MKRAQAQLLAKAADQDQSDRAQHENWANECKKCVANADEHETKMETLLAKMDNAAPVGKDPEMH
eukprot:6529040-Pyramimonas_sp.AAC.1